MWEAYLPRTLTHAHYHYNAGFTIPQKCQFSAEFSQSIDRMGYYLGPVMEIL